MGRPIGSKNKKPAAKYRTSYQTYEYWYDKYTSPEKTKYGTKDKSKLFYPKLTEQEFNKEMEVLNKAALNNPKFRNNKARWIARMQEVVDRKFEQQYWKKYHKIPELYATEMDTTTGEQVIDKETSAELRKNLFEDFVNEVRKQGNFNTDYDLYKEARDQFMAYYY